MEGGALGSTGVAGDEQGGRQGRAAAGSQPLGATEWPEGGGTQEGWATAVRQGKSLKKEKKASYIKYCQVLADRAAQHSKTPRISSIKKLI